MITNKICIVGWHFFSDFYKYLSKNYQKETFIVAHKYNKILDELKLNYKVIKNVGLEFGAYDWYIKNIWDKKSNVLFMHDDTKIERDKCLYNIFEKNNKNKIDHSYIFGEKGKGSHGRCIYMSNKFIKIIFKDYNGIWYDKENNGYVITGDAKKRNFDKKRYNYGIYKFNRYSIAIGKKYNLKTGIAINNSDLILYYRAKTVLK